MPERGFFSVVVTQPVVIAVGAGVSEAQAEFPFPPPWDTAVAGTWPGRPPAAWL